MTRCLLPACLILALLPAAPAASPIADKNLEAVIRDTLKEPIKGDLTDENLKNVYVLDTAGNKGIKDLAGLEKCINLLSLKADHNQISDLKPLKGLTNLQSLDLSFNEVSDISPLASLTKLQFIELSHNKVAKIDALKD